ncbi:glycoside hydrolase family 3 protein [Aspergillus affinis]|uniref:glycoside hydrolase family 3 protein n=1 Tax=Aspergillus affinis TaxID=1070780 RepID=UPI0022FE9DFA|nr:glycoside hydrolase superfamily [Aspergillus affinis]KAI9037075.1 glycoside hydrolase superfamily [Aspergillus affinis]
MTVSSDQYTFQDALHSIKHGDESLSDATARLLSQLTQSERLWLLDGDEAFWPGLGQMMLDRYNRHPYVHGAVPRLSIPGVRFTDGPRGVVLEESTTFPISMARGATWDISLERRIGQAIGLEAKAQGANFFAGVCVNLPRHPAWGRIQETYSEDPLLLGDFGLALTQGVQEHVMACVKHYALNSMENARFRVDVKIDEDVLHEVFLAHFRKIIEGGVASVMSSYNSVNGEWAGQNHDLLTDILRGKWGFDGFVMSDFMFGLRDSAKSVKNGLDIEAPFRQQRAMHLENALVKGELDWPHVDRSCEKILRKQLEFTLRTAESQPDRSVVFCEEHRALSREAAARSMVLLKNEIVEGQRILPLKAESITKIAVVGRLANIANTGDKGSSQTFSPHVITPLEGVQKAFPNAEVIHAVSLEEAKHAAAQVDVVICVVGFDHEDEGEYCIPALRENPSLRAVFPPTNGPEDERIKEMYEKEGDDQGTGMTTGVGGDRKSLRLRPSEEELIREVTKSNPRTVVSVIAAGTVMMESWRKLPSSILLSWYSGCEGGHGLTDVLLGKIDASGRLPFAIPTDEAHLPFFDRDASEIRYDRWFGQHLLDKLEVAPAFPFGFGLSYTEFSIQNVTCEKKADSAEEFEVRIQVKNVGSVQGRFVAQVYGLPSVPDLPTRILLGFAPKDINPAEQVNITVTASLRPLQKWVAGGFVLPKGKVEIEVGQFSGDKQGRKTVLTLD